MKKSELEATLAAYKQENQRLRDEKARKIANYRYRFCYLRSERDSALNTYPKEIKKLNEQLIKYKRSFEVGDDR